MSRKSSLPGRVTNGAMVSIQSRAPEQAMSAGSLGTHRSGQGVRLREDGLIVTAGYLVIEAEHVWITSSDGRAAPGYIVAQDYDSGLALLGTAIPIGADHLQPGTCDNLYPGDQVQICRLGERLPSRHKLVAKQEFAGRWEYLLEEALYVTPPIENWAGAGLLNDAGEVCGIGSLMLDIPVSAFATTPGNMFIPLELITPWIDEMCANGRRSTPPRPWLGTLIQEYEGKLILVGIYNHCPAHAAGLAPGDIIVAVNDEPVTGLADMLRKVWSLGSAGITIPLTITRAGRLRRHLVLSKDRVEYFSPKVSASIN